LPEFSTLEDVECTTFTYRIVPSIMALLKVENSAPKTL
jgi:hypothetical protein